MSLPPFPSLALTPGKSRLVAGCRYPILPSYFSLPLPKCRAKKGAWSSSSADCRLKSHVMLLLSIHFWRRHCKQSVPLLQTIPLPKKLVPLKHAPRTHRNMLQVPSRNAASTSKPTVRPSNTLRVLPKHVLSILQTRG